MYHSSLNDELKSKVLNSWVWLFSDNEIRSTIEMVCVEVFVGNNDDEDVWEVTLE